jgi:hypothetical protein
VNGAAPGDREYALVWGKRRDAMKKARVYLPYFSYRAHFDTTQARAAMAASGAHVPQVRDYFQKLVDYAVDSDWGRRDPRAAPPPHGSPENVT